jgi:hypothetical protein
MSEYQYYEFQAVDRSLTDEEMAELRAFSTRADITPNSFVNQYSWGSFKGDEDGWMDEYFDGFLYYANWGTRVLKLRIPVALLDLQTAQIYCNGENLSARTSGDKIILNFMSENEEGEEWEVDMHLSTFLSLRSDLVRGDLRCLYLGWLSGLQEGECDDSELEPPVPVGLAQLNRSLIDLADFLRIDPDLIEVASQTSPSLEAAMPRQSDIRGWVAALRVNEKEDWLVDILEGGLKEDRVPATKFVRSFDKAWQDKQSDGERSSSLRRTAAELLQQAKGVRSARLCREAEKAATERAERQKSERLVREKRLDEIVGRELLLWDQIESFIAEKKSSSYERAIELLMDLRDLAARGDVHEFLVKVAALKQRHSAKSSFIGRLRNLDVRESGTNV